MSLRYKKLSILLVEDDLTLQRCVKIMLESMGCEVSVASTISEALEKFKLEIDGVLTDIGLPDGSGCDFVRSIEQNFPENTVVIDSYSAFPREYIREKFGDIPTKVRRHFSKPFSQSDIENFVTAVRDNKRSVAREKSCL